MCTRIGRGSLGAALAVLALTALPLSRPPIVVSAAPSQAVEGAQVFSTSGCAHCHGADGAGTDRAPTLHNLRKKMPEAKIREQIVHGGQGMPAFGDALQPAQIDALVAFLHAKKWTPPPPPTAQ